MYRNEKEVDLKKREKLKKAIFIGATSAVALTNFKSVDGLIFGSNPQAPVSSGGSSFTNPLTVDLVGTDFIKTRSGSITRASGYVSEIAKTSGRTITVTRTDGYISSISDGTRTWTFTRNGDNQITDWSVT
jgi:hypothetical protein